MARITASPLHRLPCAILLRMGFTLAVHHMGHLRGGILHVHRVAHTGHHFQHRLHTTAPEGKEKVRCDRSQHKNRRILLPPEIFADDLRLGGLCGAPLLGCYLAAGAIRARVVAADSGAVHLIFLFGRLPRVGSQVLTSPFPLPKECASESVPRALGSHLASFPVAFAHERSGVRGECCGAAAGAYSCV